LSVIGAHNAEHPSRRHVALSDKRPLAGPFSHPRDKAYGLAANDRDHRIVIDEHRRIVATFIATARDTGFNKLGAIDFLHFKYSSDEIKFNVVRQNNHALANRAHHRHCFYRKKSGLT
jgi:hypothetical protein